MPREPQILLIDADDTLWEENLHFERAIQDFLALVAPLGYAADLIRRQLDETERRNIHRRGYGADSFALTLEEVYLSFAGHRAAESEVAELRRVARRLREEPRRVYEGVPETLAYLAGRHRLLLFTKGKIDEQAYKMATSGLGRYFEAQECVPEKNETAYRALLERHRLAPAEVWMVGNSPRSDINPALGAGMNAVYIPSPHKWEYEHEEIRPGPGALLVLASFGELREHF